MAGPSADKTAALMVVQMEWLSAAKKAEYWVEHSAALLVDKKAGYLVVMMVAMRADR